MPVSTIANGYLGLGISGAALFIVLVATYIQSKQNSKMFNNMLTNWQKTLSEQNSTMITNWQKTITEMQKNETNTQNTKLDKLCDKIDELVTATAANTKELSKNLLSNDKDQKALVNKIDMLMEIAVENQRRISRIDDRTYACLGNQKKGQEDK
jgi:septal ring factor EnvC (AmiA/AmiB activator)